MTHKEITKIAEKIQEQHRNELLAKQNADWDTKYSRLHGRYRAAHDDYCEGIEDLVNAIAKRLPCKMY